MQVKSKQAAFVQIGMYSIRDPEGNFGLGAPLYMQVSDEREFNAGRDKLLRQISKILIEQYKRKILSRLAESPATECANAG